MALIGSCTNSSYEDISRVADVVRQAKRTGSSGRVPFMVTPGSEQVRATIERDGQMAELESFGATVLANACGPCIGQWKRDEIEPGDKNTIVTSFNRNFPRRNDGNPDTLAFIGSPEIVAAYAIVRRARVRPADETRSRRRRQSFKLDPPGPAPDLPPTASCATPRATWRRRQTAAGRDHDRARQRTAAAARPVRGVGRRRLRELPLLLKAKGKCTTDHISPAGPWLRFRGHLDNISDNMFTGAINAFTGEAGRPPTS